MKGLILAGGKGTRLRPLTLHTPKPIVPVANRPLLLYQLDLLKSAGIREVVLSLSYQPRKIEDLLKDGADYDVLIHYAVEKTPLGTAGAVKNAAPWIDSPIVVFNGDVLTGVDLGAVIEAHRACGAVATLVLTPVEDPTAYGLVECAEDGRIRRFLEKPRPEEITGNTINAGIYVLEPSVLEHIPPNQPYSFEHELFPALLEAGLPLYGIALDQYWIDIGAPAKYLELHRNILDGVYRPAATPPSALNRAALPAGAFVDEKSLLAEGVTIREGVRVESSVIGPNSKLEAGAEVVGSVVWSGATIEADARVRGAILGHGCYIGRSAVVGAGTVLGGKSAITDFSVVGGEGTA